MNAAFEKRLAIAWIILSVITGASYFAKVSNPSEALRPSAMFTVSVIALSLVKVRLIFMEFMELRGAPVLLGRLADAWLLATAGALLGSYFGVPYWAAMNR